VHNPGIKCVLPDGTMIRGLKKQRDYMRKHYPNSPSLKPATQVKKSKKSDQSKNSSKKTNSKKRIKAGTLLKYVKKCDR
jgi:hypothetical protein